LKTSYGLDLLSNFYNKPSIKAILEDENKANQSELVAVFKSAVMYIVKMQGIDAEKVDNHLMLGIYDIVTSKYKRLSPTELKRAFELAYSGKLSLTDKELECYGSIKITYVTRLLDAYLKYRDVEKYKLLETEKNPKLTADEKMTRNIEACKDAIIKGYENHLLEDDTHPVHLAFWHYDILKGLDLITVTDAKRIEILKVQRVLYKPIGDISTMRDVPMDKAKVVTIKKQFAIWKEERYPVDKIRELLNVNNNCYIKILTNK